MNRFKFIIKNLIGHRNLRELSYLGKVASDYLKDRAATVLWHEEHIYFGQILSELSDNLNVIDVPVGTGRFAPLYQLKKWNVVGVDVSQEMLNVAKTYNSKAKNFALQQGSITNLPFEDNQFEVAVCSRFLGYILTVSDAKIALSELTRVTSQKIIVGLQYVRDTSDYGEIDKIGHKFKRDELIDLLTEYNLSVVKSIAISEKDNYRNEIFVLALDK